MWSEYKLCFCAAWHFGVSRAFLRINTLVILLGGVIRGNPWVVQAEMEGCNV